MQALQHFLDNQPAEAIAYLHGYDKFSQDLLLSLLPLTARLAEGGWDQVDSREASAVVEQLDQVAERVSASLRPRAKLVIKKMCFCSAIKGYGKYLPWPEVKGFLPGEPAEIYVELENLRDERDEKHGNTFSFHLLSTIDVYDFRQNSLWQHRFKDNGPDVSQSERHDFYMPYHFVVPPKLNPGYYTLSLKIVDERTHREAIRTLDFRVTADHAKGQW